MNKKMNNKGFSLVELIVVMAVMAILAVSLAPRLTQYIDKARQTNDREIPNAVYTAVKYGLLDEDISDEVAASTTTDDFDWNTGVDVLTELYTYTADGSGAYTKKTGVTLDRLGSEIVQTLGDNFKLQSELADTTTALLMVTFAADGTFTVHFKYAATVVGEYTMDSADAY